jgi:deoxycytidylate deaminase
LFKAGILLVGRIGCLESKYKENWKNIMSDDVELDDNFRSILSGKLPGSELVIGLVGAVGANLKNIVEDLTECLEEFDYEAQEIHVSELIVNFTTIPDYDKKNYFERTNALMTAGDNARKNTSNNAIMALATVDQIRGYRLKQKEGNLPVTRHAFIVNSLKHPSEVAALRQIYGAGFILIGVYVKYNKRKYFLERIQGLSELESQTLIERDEAEGQEYGQQTRNVFHLSDFFVHLLAGDKNEQFKTQATLRRYLDIIFGYPYNTPIFDEYAMFMAFAAAVRSSDLSRQVGAVIAKHDDILSTGANECPRPGGGTYWPYVTEMNLVKDIEGGREYMLGHDTNDLNKASIIADSIEKMKQSWQDSSNETIPEEGWVLLRKALEDSSIQEITEYGRVVHAEMTALLTCARNGISCRGATLYVTTFPCHNCAKHIIAAGIRRVVYVEPYPKSKAFEFHADSAVDGFEIERDNKESRVIFEPFVGVGPRRFFDLFSMKQGSGYPLKRKDKVTGKILTWNKKNGIMRIPELPWSYLEREVISAKIMEQHLKGEDDEQ